MLPKEWRVEDFLKVDKQGRITIPSSVRQKLEIVPGKTVMRIIACSDGDELITLRRWQ